MIKKSNKKTIAIIMSLVLFVIGLFAYQEYAFARVNKMVKSVSFTSPSVSTVYLQKGETFKLKVKVLPRNAENKKVSYKTSKKTVATVSSKGEILAKNIGKTTITVVTKDGSKKKESIKVQVVKTLKKIKKISLKCKNATLYVDGSNREKTISLKASILPKNATVKAVKYISSDQSVASVTKKGVVIAKKEGITLITTYAADGRGAKATCKITVKKKNAESETNPTESPSTNPSASPTAVPVTPVPATPVPTTTPDPNATIPPSEVGEKMAFTSDNNYRSYAVVSISLPDGVNASDIIGISFGVDTEKDLSLRLYAGEVNESSKELTTQTQEVEDVITGSEAVSIDGSIVTKNLHQLNIKLKESTRIQVTPGNYHEVSFAVDEGAKTVLSEVDGNTMKLSIYAHNIKPEFNFYNLKVTTSSGTYSVVLSNTTVEGVAGANVNVIAN